MTKVVNFYSEQSVQKEELKPIELVKVIHFDKMLDSITKSNDFCYISLVSPKENNQINYDLIVCWNDPGLKIFYWGHWNDGVIE